MTTPQLLSFLLMGGSILMFAWGRFRYDTISLVVLALAVLLGVVDPKKAFEGFASDVVVIIASALVVSAAISRSGVIEPILRPLLSRLRTPKTQVPALASATAVLSMASKNVGALATLMPVAIRMGRSPTSNPSLLLMPMAFLSLLGGLVTLVGTSTNIIVSEVRQQALGKPFELFDFAPVGLSLTLIGILFVSVAWRLLPTDRTPRAALSEVHADVHYATEAQLGDNWPTELATVHDLALADHGVTLTGLLAADGSSRMLLPDAQLAPGMTLQFQADDEALGALFARLPLLPVRHDAELTGHEAHEEVRTIEAVVEAHSPMVGQTAASLKLLHDYQTKLLGISRRGTRIRERLQDAPFQPGDLLLLQASEGVIPTALRDLGALPLAERPVQMGSRRHRYGPILILAAAMILVALKILTVTIAFFVAAVLMVVIGSLSMREAYNSLEPEVIVLIGALTPLSHAIQDTGGTALIAEALTGFVQTLTPTMVVGGMMFAAMAVSPFLHNAPTVLMLAPLGVMMAQRLGINPDAALMAVATGSGCDFLTPIGHQCNTLVRGPGGYRFGDYLRLGAPLSVMVLIFGTLLISHFWL